MCNSNFYTPLFYAVMHGNIEVTQYLINNGANSEHIDSDGNTLLHLSPNKNITTLLLDKTKINISSKNIHHNTPLHAQNVMPNECFESPITNEGCLTRLSIVKYFFAG